MMKARNAALGLLCAFVLVIGSVAATVAYLTSEASVTNTFTVGQVGIELDEQKVDEYGKAIAGANRVEANEYKLIPGQTYVKDPTVHFAAGSEASWLFVKIDNGIAGIEVEGDDAIADQIEANGWEQLAGVRGFYWKSVDKHDSDDAEDYPIFSKFAIDGNKATNEVLKESYAGKTVVVTAYAVQQAGFETAAAAWSATFGK
ncbi:MAG: SipW-dependent-type signal peptide-containing protein [Eggerthellaceae bacterium]|nr:SipW-dependent-type signal peptide-containing protein [Eggerthellaceae bacterium]